jgi:mannose-6-phosphate isomerase
MYPLKFKPYLKFYPYGGRRFVEVLEKDGVPRDRDVAETWEISDHGEEQSVVMNGPLVGQTLRQLMTQFGAQLVGAEVWDRYGDYFPLLVKFLDCDKRLPAHMHPNDADAARLGLPDKGKTEAWYILRADPGAGAYIGSRFDLTPLAFQEAHAAGNNYDGVMNKVSTTTGETYFVPAGRLHGLGEGNLAFEIQQNSDAGFGWDWGQFVEDGVISVADAAKHPALAVECALYENGAQETTSYVTLDLGGVERVFCCASKYFVLEKWRGGKPFSFVDSAARFNTFTLINGAATIRGGGEEVFARRGESLLIPAGVEIEIVPQALTNAGEVELLRCYVPDLARDIVAPLREAGIDDTSIAWLGSYGRGNDLSLLLGLPADAFLVTGAERQERIDQAHDSRDETS